MKSLLLFSVLFSLSRHFSTLSHFANGALVNQTIDDSDFSYFPVDKWQSSNNASCITCLQPDFTLAFQETLHYAIHASGPDADDAGKSLSLSPSGSEAPVPPSVATTSPPPSVIPSSASSPPPSVISSTSSPQPSVSSLPLSLVLSSSSTAPSSAATVAVVSTANGAPSSSSSAPSSSTTNDSSGKGRGHSGSHSRARLAKYRRTDADDPNFVDVNMTATVNFTGSAFSVFCALPVQINNASMLALTNLTFFLDGRKVGNFTYDPRTDSSSNTGFQYQVMVFSKDDIPYGPHVLVIKPALGSMALLDYVQYATLDTASGTNDTGSAIPQATPSGVVASASTPSSNKNTTSFAIAIGSSMGVLAVVAFAVFISICVRRRRSAKREKQREAMEAMNRPPSPEMSGPRPFIPRYFPGNIPPRAPSPLFAPLLPTSNSGEDIGPSHGLEFPPAPEHLDAPAYSPPPLVLSEVSRIPVSLRPPVTPQPLVMEEVQLPQYHDVARTPLMSFPTSIHPSTHPPGFVESSSSMSWGASGGQTSFASSSLPERSDIDRDESTAWRTNTSQIHANTDEQPG